MTRSRERQRIKHWGTYNWCTTHVGQEIPPICYCLLCSVAFTRARTRTNYPIIIIITTTSRGLVVFGLNASLEWGGDSRNRSAKNRFKLFQLTSRLTVHRPLSGQVRGWGSSAANATRTGGRVSVRSSDGVARLRVKLELGFLRQVFADWALVSGERRCRRSHAVDVVVGKEFWILGWGKTNEWRVYWRVWTSENFRVQSQIAISARRCNTCLWAPRERAVDRTSETVRYFDSQPRCDL